MAHSLCARAKFQQKISTVKDLLSEIGSKSRNNRLQNTLKNNLLTLEILHSPDQVYSLPDPQALGVPTRDGILTENKFRISDDLFRIHLGRASISAKFRMICINFV